jgi:hypothetical protein
MLRIRLEQINKTANYLVIFGIGASFLQTNTQSSGISKL